MTVLVVELLTACGMVTVRRVYTSVRAGWWVVWSKGGSGTFSVAAKSAVISSLWVALSVGDGQGEAGFTIGDKRNRGAVASGNDVDPSGDAGDGGVQQGRNRLAEMPAVHR